jgi:hypothetical protein
LTPVPGLGVPVATRAGLGPKEIAARQTVGAGLVYLANDYAAKGGITGPGPDDPDKRALMVKDGWQPSSTYVPHVGWVPNLAFLAAAPILNGVGAYQDSLRYATDKENADADKFRDRVVKDQARVWAQFPVLQGMAALAAMTQNFTRGTTDLLASAGSSYVPAPLKTYEASQDPYQRTTDREGSFGEQLRQKLIARSGEIPGLGNRQDLPVAQDRFGRPIENPRQGIASVLPRVGQQKGDPASRLFSETGVDVGLPPKELSVTIYSGTSKQGTAVPIPLTPAEQREWNTVRGEALLGLVGGLEQNAKWQAASPEERRKYLQQKVTEANEYAKGRMITRIGDAGLRQRMDLPGVRKAS